MKAEKRRLAIKKAKQKKMIIISACIAASVLIIAAVVYFAVRQGGDRVYASGNESVTLYSDGSFSARLYHGLVITGTYSESKQGRLTVVAFSHDGTVSNGTIEGKVLDLPEEWEDDHGHGHDATFTLK